MSTEMPSRDDEVRDHIQTTLRREIPQLTMHGGESAIVDLDLDEGHVALRLGGACNGCGLAPMTITAIQNRLVEHVPQLNSVSVETGLGHDDNPGTDDAPF